MPPQTIREDFEKEIHSEISSLYDADERDIDWAKENVSKKIDVFIYRFKKYIETEIIGEDQEHYQCCNKPLGGACICGSEEANHLKEAQRAKLSELK